VVIKITIKFSKAIVILIVASLLPTAVAPAGDMVGNGGKIVICDEPQPTQLGEQPEAGIYSLDYVQMRDAVAFHQPASLNDSFDRIEELIVKIPDMHKSFKEYRRLIRNDSAFNGNRVWKLSSLKLVEVKDAMTLRELPGNCVHQQIGDEYGAFQIIIRRKAGDIVFYEAFKPLLDKIDRDPLQASLLYVHEWLWDYATDAYQSRQANVLLHSTEAAERRDDLQGLFRRIGITSKQTAEAQPSTAVVGGSVTVAGREGETSLAGMKFVKIPKGTFLMGSHSSEFGRLSDENQHRVTITYDFFIQTTEVTQEQWFKVMGDNPSKFNAEQDCPGDYKQMSGVGLCPNNPVERVSWHDVQLFVAKMYEKRDGFRYRLPTEAEWEYAARGGSTGPYSVAGNLADFAWFGDNSGNRTHAVAKLKPNAYGLYDVHGNVWEWTSDWYGSYPNSNVTDPVGANSSSYAVSRGGSWYAPARYCRSAFRDRWRPDGRSSGLGFRLVRMPSP